MKQGGVCGGMAGCMCVCVVYVCVAGCVCVYLCVVCVCVPQSCVNHEGKSLAQNCITHARNQSNFLVIFGIVVEEIKVASCGFF